MRTGADETHDFWWAWRWIALGLGLITGVALLGAGIQAVAKTDWSVSPWTDALWLVVFPAGTCLGYVLAWRRELVGALVALACLVVIYLAAAMAGQRPAHVPYLYPFGGPALLLIMHWAFAPHGRREAEA